MTRSGNLASTLRGAAIFAGLLVLPGVPLAFVLALVLSMSGLARLALYLAPAAAGALIAYTRVRVFGGTEPAAACVRSVILGTIFFVVAVVAIAALTLGPAFAESARDLIVNALLLIGSASGAALFAARRRAAADEDATSASADASARSNMASTGSEGRTVAVASDGEALVGIIMGSDSDMPVMEECAKQLEALGVPYEMTVASAHRSPAQVHDWASGAAGRGIRVIIAAAGKAAHLGGVVAAYTPLPVITVPMKTSDLGGLDSLLSMVQMPTGVPVACVAINGARNAAILATQILGTSMPAYREAIERLKSEMAGG